MKAKMETAAGRSGGRPTLALTRSLSLCVPQPTEGTNDELNSHARRLLAPLARRGLVDAAAQRARPSTIKILPGAPAAAPRASTTPAALNSSLAGCRQRRARERERGREAHAPFFLQTPPHSHTLGDFQP
jgi:hypothetical protein